MSFDANRAAAFVVAAHDQREAYRNLPDDIAPRTVADAYGVQEALVPLWREKFGGIAGLKIATTTKIMQQLMGIDHPCGSIIYERRVHASPATIAKSDFRNLVVECELAVRLAADLPAREAPFTRDSVRAGVGEIMAAFELIEDRNAVYKETRALSLIADNAWNGGIVLGPAMKLPSGLELDGLAGALAVDGVPHKSGKTDDPLGALAWVANLAIERGRPMTRGMVVITGSVIPTLPIAAGQTFEFEIAGVGTTRMTAD